MKGGKLLEGTTLPESLVDEQAFVKAERSSAEHGEHACFSVVDWSHLVAGLSAGLLLECLLMVVPFPVLFLEPVQPAVVDCCVAEWLVTLEFSQKELARKVFTVEPGAKELEKLVVKVMEAIKWVGGHSMSSSCLSKSLISFSSLSTFPSS